MRIPIPTYNEPELEKLEFIKALAPDNEWVKWYMDCPNWKCECKLTNFGRNQFCARWTCKKARPIEYRENEYEPR